MQNDNNIKQVQQDKKAMKINYGAIGLGVTIILTFGTLLFRIGSLSGQVLSQKEQIEVLQKSKLDIAVYESDLRRVDNSIGELKNNNRE